MQSKRNNTDDTLTISTATERRNVFEREKIFCGDNDSRRRRDVGKNVVGRNGSRVLNRRDGVARIEPRIFGSQRLHWSGYFALGCLVEPHEFGGGHSSFGSSFRARDYQRQYRYRRKKFFQVQKHLSFSVYVEIVEVSFILFRFDCADVSRHVIEIYLRCSRMDTAIS